MAANTDLFKKLSRRWVGQIGSGGVADNSTTTIPLASTTNLPTGTAVVATIDRVDANGSATSSIEETVIGVVSGSNLVNCVRGSEGTAQAHSAGAVVEILVTAKGYNDMIDGILAEHTQLGIHNIPSTSLISQYAADTGAADAYVVTLSPVVASLVTGMVVRFKAANANTTASTLAVNGLAAKPIKKLGGATALIAGDIAAGQLVTCVYDGTNFQLQSQTGNAPSDALLAVTDITTNNVSTSKHGFAPKAPNDATKYLDGTGAYSVPAGSPPNFASTGKQTGFSTVSTTYVDVTGVTLTINPTAAAKVHAVVTGRFSCATALTNYRVRLLIDGTLVDGDFDFAPTATGNGWFFALSGQLSVASGARVIKLQALTGNGSDALLIDSANLSVIWA